MKLIAYYALYMAIFLFAGCTTSAYYVSPLYGSSNSYRTLPFMTDSVKNSLYANGSVTIANTNQNLHDDVYLLQGNIYNANQFAGWKVWYGAGLSSGLYHLKAFDKDDVINPNFDTSYINRQAGNYFFGSYNFNAGLAYCVPLGNGSEWRVLHFSPSFQHEFGEYKKFRKALINDSVAVTGVAASSALTTLALGSEIAIQSRKKEQFSFGLTYSWIAGKEYKNKHLTFFTKNHRADIATSHYPALTHSNNIRHSYNFPSDTGLPVCR